MKRTGHGNILFITFGILAVLFLGYVIVAVSLKDSKQAEDIPIVSENQVESDVKMVTLPFKAEFAAHYTSNYEDVSRCGKLPFTRVIVDGTGTEPNLGKFTVHMDFCIDGGSGIYIDMLNSYFTTAEGDSLFIITWGQVGHPDENDPPYYTDKWDDPFEFTGGTGRFEEATGGGMTHCYNSTEDNLSHHTWEGTLTMKAE